MQRQLPAATNKASRSLYLIAAPSWDPFRSILLTTDGGVTLTGISGDSDSLGRFNPFRTSNTNSVFWYLNLLAVTAAAAAEASGKGDRSFFLEKFASGITIPVEMRETAENVGTEIRMTLRAATYKLLRFHVHDWIVLCSLVVLDGLLNIIHPFYRFVGASMMGDLMYPLKSNTIPFEIVPVIAIVIPLVFIVGYFLYKKNLTDLHHATLGLLFSVLITAVITDSVKDAVGRPRPDFFWRCFPNGTAVYHNVTGDVVCNGLPQVIKEGHKSFPSGHTSWSFAGLGFLSLYLAGKIQVFNRRGHVAKTAIVLLPLLGALLVGLSRVDDYWHHWQDVFAGALLGFIMAVFCYHQFFPSLHDVNSMGPYSYLEIGNNFELAWFRWNRRQRPSTQSWPPRENGLDHDMEGGRSGEDALASDIQHGSLRN